MVSGRTPAATQSDSPKTADGQTAIVLDAEASGAVATFIGADSLGRVEVTPEENGVRLAIEVAANEWLGLRLVLGPSESGWAAGPCSVHVDKETRGTRAEASESARVALRHLARRAKRGSLDASSALAHASAALQPRARAERLRPDDRISVDDETQHRDYILTEYEPVVTPEGRLQPLSLLRHLMRDAGVFDVAWPVCERLREGLGSDETVWGFKYGPDGVAVELYFYNFVANGPDNPESFQRVARILDGLVHFESRVDEASPYFMWSFELDAEGRASKPRVYLGSGEKARRQCGFSYRVEPGRTVLENHYWFYYGAEPAEVADVRRRLEYSPRSGAPSAHPRLLPAYLLDAHTICYAVKPNADGLYFARITSAQLAAWLDSVRPSLAATLRTHAEDFAHARWDLGFDFAGSPSDSAVAIRKYAVHGVF